MSHGVDRGGVVVQVHLAPGAVTVLPATNQRTVLSVSMSTNQKLAIPAHSIQISKSFSAPHITVEEQVAETELVSGADPGHRVKKHLETLQ